MARAPHLLLLAAIAIGLAHAAVAHQPPGSGQPAAAAGTPDDPAPVLDQAVAMRVSQARLGATVGDYTLRDRNNIPVSLARYRGKPLLVNFIYTGCIHACPASTHALRTAVNAIRDRFGVNQFNVVTIGFNQPDDSPEAMKAFAAQQRINDPNWDFLSPRAADVAPLTRDFGFSYVPTLAGFEHVAQVSLVDAQGRIFQQIYGGSFAATALGEPLKQLLTGVPMIKSTSVADLLERVSILCSVYDPVTGKYRVSYGLVFEIAGGGTFLLAMLVFALLEWRAHWRARRLLTSA
jgi:protein SCO1/2